MEMAQKGINIAAENTQAAESRIRDTDMAKEMVDYTKNQILAQASIAMLSQANSNSQSVLSLLK
jgi:flagellin